MNNTQPKFTAIITVSRIPDSMQDDSDFWPSAMGQGDTAEDAFQDAFESGTEAGYTMSPAGAIMCQSYMDQFDGASGIAPVSVTFGRYGYEYFEVGEYEEAVDGSCSDKSENFSNGYQ